MQQSTKRTLICFFMTLVFLAAMMPPVASAAESKAPPSGGPGKESAPVEEKTPPEGALSATEILSNSLIVAHGMGAVDGINTLNCLEGFQAQYAAGVRVFEADLRLTRDGQVVLRHDWWNSDLQEGVSWSSIPTREKFLASPLCGRYTPLSFRDLLLLMELYPDICVITDTKFTESDVFTLQFLAMLDDAKELGLTYLFDRIAVQVYNTNMITALNALHPFPHYIYTFYQDYFDGTEAVLRERLAICAQRHVEGITMEQTLWKDEYAAIAKEYGVRLYVHTVNDPDAAQKLLDGGCAAVYSDSLTPSSLVPLAPLAPLAPAL